MNIVLIGIGQKESKTDKDHLFVTLGPNCWGVGETSDESLKNCKANAPHGYRGNYITRIAPKQGLQIDPVDGAIQWDGTHNTRDCSVCSVGKGVAIQYLNKPPKDERTRTR